MYVRRCFNGKTEGGHGKRGKDGCYEKSGDDGISMRCLCTIHAQVLRTVRNPEAYRLCLCICKSVFVVCRVFPSPSAAADYVSFPRADRAGAADCSNHVAVSTSPLPVASGGDLTTPARPSRQTAEGGFL